MSTIGQLFVGILALIGVAILATGAVEGSSAGIIGGCFWLGFAVIVWFIGMRRDKADQAKDAMVRKFAELQGRGERREETTTYEVLDAHPSSKDRRRELMEQKRDLLLEEELEDEILELEERRRSRMLRRGDDTRRLGSG